MDKPRASHPLARELLLLVLASAAPAAAFAAALAASFYNPDWQNGLLLVLSATALVAGVYVSWLLARGFAIALEDIAADARMLVRGAPLACFEPQLRELVVIADTLKAAARQRPREPLRVDLAEGAQKWSDAVAARYRGTDRNMPIAPTREGCDLSAVLARLARGFAPAAAAAGVALAFDVTPALPFVGGMERDLETALFGLLDAALAVTSRGGRVMLRARALADGAVKIVLGAEAPANAAMPGIAGAGGMIELTCGATLAASLARARALVAGSGGELVPGTGTIALLLAPAAPLTHAA